MAGQSSNLGATSSTRKQEGKRKQSATRAEKAKKPNVTARPRGSSIPVVPPNCPTSHAMAVAFPMAGVNGAAPVWSTAAALGAATGAAALALPAAAGANGPAATAALVPSPGAASIVTVAAPAPPASRATQRRRHAGAGVCIPLAAALDKINGNTLGSLLSALMPACLPPLQPGHGMAGAPPPWWPTASEDWWVPELVAHLPTMPLHTPVPFVPLYRLKKGQKVAVLVAVVKHLAPDFTRILSEVSLKAKLSIWEAILWNSALVSEWAKCMRPRLVVNGDDDGHRQARSSTTSSAIVVHGGVAAADRCEQIANNLPGDSVTTPADDAGQHLTEPEQNGDMLVNDVAEAELKQQFEDMLASPLQLQQAG
ncbi:hypothetical protein C2845_PM03G25020 [Panicum miliaceum]|uniref:Ethylene insensitive 3-like DNA-binding domain-containing protein n=1 Tax=Panicum miliaceum TaxID=4540 RepID=A0A3L6TBP4_PANMI|nr:hypothetical protein C2845_PM03G25020 [Panicum miliaceum]